MRSVPVALGASLVATMLIVPDFGAAEPLEDKPTTEAIASLPVNPSHPSQVTLITGDVVTYLASTGAPIINVQKANSPVTVSADPSGVYAIPEEARMLVAAGQIDKQLFNVKYLVEEGFSDAAAVNLPVIASLDLGPHPASTESLATTSQSLPGLTHAVSLESISGVALDIDKSRAASFWDAAFPEGATPSAAGQHSSPKIRKLWLDAKVTAALDESVPFVGADTVHNAGLDGRGVTVAVLDTGYDPKHPDLEGRVVGRRSFVGGDVTDRHGHGTHVAATIAGTGAASEGRYRGVAPGADLLIAKVLNDGGSGSTSGIISAMEWAVREGADVVNLSLGSDIPSDGDDPFSTSLDALSASSDAIFVVAAGNSGPGRESVSAPGAAKQALTVGAVSKEGNVASFSSSGPLYQSARLKPEIAAPGVGIVAARAAGTRMPTPVNRLYTRANGTSMATPHVAGAAALVAQARPDLDGQEIKDVLLASATASADSVYRVGAGLLSVEKAVKQKARASRPVIDFGPQNSGGAATVSQVTEIINDSSETQTFSLRLEGSGDLSATSVFTITPQALTIPPGASAPVTVTFDKSQATVGSQHEARVVAESKTNTDDGTVVIPVGVVYGEQRPDLTVTVSLPDDVSRPAGCVAIVDVVDFDSALLTSVVTQKSATSDDCTATVPLKKGYLHSLSVSMDGTTSDGKPVRLMAMIPEVIGGATKTEQFDFNRAHPVIVNTERSTVAVSRWPFFVRTGADPDTWFWTGADMTFAHPTSEVRILPTDPVSIGRFGFEDMAQLNDSETPTHPEYVYYSRIFLPGAIPDDPSQLNFSLGASNMMTADAEYRKTHDAPTWNAWHNAIARPRAFPFVPLPWSGLQAPSKRTEYYGPTTSATGAWSDMEWTDYANVSEALLGYPATSSPTWRDTGQALTFGVPGNRPMPLPAEGFFEGRNDSRYFCHACTDGSGALVLAIPAQNGDGMWDRHAESFGIASPSLSNWPSARETLSLTVDGRSIEPVVLDGPGYAPGSTYTATLFDGAVVGEPVELTQILNKASSVRGAKTQTTWSFTPTPHSEHDHAYRCFDSFDRDARSCTPQALPFLNYHITGLDSANTISAGGSAEILVSPVYQLGIQGDIERLDAQMSFDGGLAWTPVPSVAGEDGSHRIRMRVPMEQDGSLASLRVTAMDSAGVQITQSQLDLFEVRGTVDEDGSPQVTELRISPDMLRLTVGQSENLEVIAVLNDGSRMDVSQHSTWSITDPEIALVDSGGVVSAKAVGEAVATVRYGGVSADINILVQAIMSDVKRVAGDNRYSTAAQLAQDSFVRGVPVTYIASGLDFPDALTGSALAGHEGGPILLTRPDALPTASIEALSALKPGKIVVVGGTGAVSNDVVRQLRGYTEGRVLRISGQDRYATAANLAKRFKDPDTIFVATGEDFPDALAASARAGSEGVPVLLVRRNSVPAATTAALDASDPKRIVVVGGRDAVSAKVYTELRSHGRRVERLGGANRYETAALLASHLSEVDNVYVATGQDWPDAVTGGAAAANHNGTLLLSRPTRVPQVTHDELMRLRAPSITILGGERSISPTVAKVLEALSYG